MFKDITKLMRNAFFLLILFTILTGIIYPLILTGIAQLLFPLKANGSFIEQNGKIIGSAFIGQYFDSPNYFWGRPSATSPFPYNAASSLASNMGPLNPLFLTIVKERVNRLQKLDPTNHAFIPIDLVTASGSGLDPEISPLAAYYQIPRIAKVNHIREQDIEVLLQGLIKNRTLGFLGEPRVNVLELNIALDKLRMMHATSQPR